jgi:hypothetical protein
MCGLNKWGSSDSCAQEISHEPLPMKGSALTTPGSVGADWAPLPLAEDAPAGGTGPACCDTIDVRPAGFAPFIYG